MTTRNQSELESGVLGFIQEHQLVLRGQKLVVAVSGGPDSVCLLHLLVRLRQELGTTLHVAHLNHQLRGAEAEADAQYVADLTNKLGLPATIEARDVKAYRVQHRLSLEEAAREVRYTFLAQVAKSVGAERVAVGHTRDDHIETILMHLIRGSGTRGLRGLQPISRWQFQGTRLIIIRPLLSLSREETQAYCHQQRLNPQLDVSNLSLSPLRNRIRQQLLPRLRSYNPKITEALLRTARIAAEEIAFLDKEIDQVWDKLVQKQENTIILDKAGVLELPSALKRHLLRTAIERLLGNIKDIEARHIEEILNALDKPAGKRISLPDGLTFAIDYDKYWLGTDFTTLSPFPVLEGEFVLKIPGETEIPGWQITAKIIDRDQMPEEARAEKVGDAFTAYLDLKKAGNRLTVRARKPGDRFQPLGMSQPKKLNEFMIDAKIPRAWRRRLPIICSEKQILWLVGYRIDERVKVTGGTQKVLFLKAERTK